MLFGGKFYTEVGELGSSSGLKTLLLRGAQGEMMVYKEAPRESAGIFQMLEKNPHPNLVTVYGIKAVDEETCGVFMEFIPSDTLDDMILRQGKFTVKEARKVMLQLCQAVGHYQKMGIIHRDLKPLNILVTAEGVVKVTDFGIARIYKKEKICDTRILGTAGYAAPEQFGFSQTDEKADIYALGVILNKMLTGKMPGDELYEGDERIGDIIKKCIRMTPGDRCELGELEEALGGKRTVRGPRWKKVLRRIPGFRTGDKVHMTLAAVEYTYILLLFLLTFGFRGNLTGRLLCVAGALIASLGLGEFVGSFRKMVYVLQIKHKVGKIFLGMFYGVIGFIILSIGFSMMTG